MTIFVTGATGLVGSHLVRALAARGDRVLALSRKAVDPGRFGPQVEGVVGDPAADGPWLARLKECDAVVHLAGEPIAARRWTDAFLKVVRESRVRSTALIAAALAGRPRRGDGSPKAWISASAVGYYGPRGDEVLLEGAAAGGDELARVCLAWERAADPAAAAGVRVAHPRIGHVLDAHQGVLPRMARPFKLFAGGPIASGKQWMSWVHIADIVGLVLFALDTPEVAGPFNATAPEPVRNREFARTLARRAAPAVLDAGAEVRAAPGGRPHGGGGRHGPAGGSRGGDGERLHVSVSRAARAPWRICCRPVSDASQKRSGSAKHASARRR